MTARKTFIPVRHRRLIIAVLGLAAWACSAPLADPCPQKLPVTDVVFNDARLEAEIAHTESARQCGLSRRDALSPGSGMLFVYNDDAVRAFWMKDTRIPLALAFVNRDRTVTQIVQMQPQPADLVYRSREPVRYALETNPNWFAEHGIRPGDTIEFQIPVDLTIEDVRVGTWLSRWLPQVF